MVFVESRQIVARRVLLAIHWLLPALAMVVAGWLNGINSFVITGIAAALMACRPVLTGPLFRTVLIVCAFTPLVRYISWPFVKAYFLWGMIGDIPWIIVRYPVYAVATLIGIALSAFIYPPVFALIEAESKVRQAVRDKAAQRIMADLRQAHGRPRFSLYLRPFKTTGFLAINVVGEVPGMQQQANIQIDFEAILASAFPAHRPLIALGEPGALLPTTPEGTKTWVDSWGIPGTGKVRSTESTWQEDLILLANAAEMIVMVPMNFPGTLWEIRWLFNHRMLGKCVFIMPPSMGGARSYEEHWRASMRILSDLGVEPLAYNPTGRLFVVENGVVRSFPSFVKSFFVPRSAALLIQFRFLQRRFSKASVDDGFSSAGTRR
jgi:hypothetical protein